MHDNTHNYGVIGTEKGATLVEELRTPPNNGCAIIMPTMLFSHINYMLLQTAELVSHAQSFHIVAHTEVGTRMGMLYREVLHVQISA